MIVSLGKFDDPSLISYETDAPIPGEDSPFFHPMMTTLPQYYLPAMQERIERGELRTGDIIPIPTRVGDSQPVFVEQSPMSVAQQFQTPIAVASPNAPSGAVFVTAPALPQSGASINAPWGVSASQYAQSLAPVMAGGDEAGAVSWRDGPQTADTAPPEIPRAALAVAALLASFLLR